MLNGQPNQTNLIEGQNNGTTSFVLGKDGDLLASSYEVYGGLNSQFLKADGSTDSTQYLTSSKINGTSGRIPKFDNDGGVVNSQIEDSANHVIIGGNGSYTEKLEVNGNVKANSFVGNATSATKLNTTRTINGVAFDGTANITIPAADITPRIATSEKGAANGVATLDANALIPSTQLPSYVDDVLEYANFASFPATGTSGKIYVAIDTNKTYRWSGSVYVFITSGAVVSVAGKTGVVTLVKGDVGLSNVDNTSDSTKSVNYAGSAGSATNANYALNAGLLLNNAPSSTGGANTIVQRDSSGYIFNNYFNTTAGGTERNTSGMGYFAGFNSTDTYIRSYTPTAVAAAISGQIMDINGTATYASNSNKWGGVTYNGSEVAVNSYLMGYGEDGSFHPIGQTNVRNFLGINNGSTLNNNISGNAVNLSTTRNNWNSTGTISAVVGELAWKSYGNGHTIFDASNSTSPDSTSVNNINSAVAWSATYPTLMGWNGLNTFGVRVDSARVADYASASDVYAWAKAASKPSYTKSEVGLSNVDNTSDASKSVNYANTAGSAPANGGNSLRANGVRFNWAGQSGQPPWLWGGNSGEESYVYNPSNFSVARAQRANGHFYIDDNFGCGIVGAYDDSRYQGVFAMGDAYKISDNGTSLANHYGIAWTHSNVGGQSKIGLGNQMLITAAGYTQTAIGKGIWTMGNITALGNISSDGNITAANDVVALSDKKLKKNIRNIDNVISRIKASRGVVYDRIDGSSVDNIGFIAQELQLNFPELISTDKDGTLGVKYQNATAVLFEAVKAQQHQIDELTLLVNKIISKNISKNAE